jgi:hypothetical protein
METESEEVIILAELDGNEECGEQESKSISFFDPPAISSLYLCLFFFLLICRYFFILLFVVCILPFPSDKVRSLLRLMLMLRSPL